MSGATVSMPAAPRELWGVQRGWAVEVLDGRRWVRCLVVCLDGEPGDESVYVRTMESAAVRRLIRVRAAHCIRLPELNEAEAFRARERARVAAIEARQARERQGARA